MVEDVTTALTQLKRRRKRHHNSRTESSFPLASIAVGTPGYSIRALVRFLHQRAESSLNEVLVER
jgi:hypothetical protein